MPALPTQTSPVFQCDYCRHVCDDDPVLELEYDDGYEAVYGWGCPQCWQRNLYAVVH